MVASLGGTLKALLNDPRVKLVGLLWFLQLFVAGLSSGPLMGALEGVPDAALSSPDGVLLLELLRIRQTNLLFGLRQSFLLLVVGQLLLVLVRARLTESIAASEFGPIGGHPLKRHLVYVGLSVVSFLIFVSVLVAGGRLMFSLLSSWDGSLQPKQIVMPGLSIALTGVLAISVLAISDAIKLSIFVPKMSQQRLDWLLRLGKTSFLPLVLVRFLRASFQLGALSVGLLVFIAPQGLGASFPMMSGIANQLLVFSVLIVEALWLNYLAKKMHEQTRIVHPFASEPV